MSKSSVLLLKRIRAVKERIFDRIRDHVVTGKQTKIFNNSSVAACGQFLVGEKFEQRGLHGTASAIAVLSKRQGENSELVSRLIAYIQSRRVFETALPEEVRIDEPRMARDDRNVIKLSELILAQWDVHLKIYPKELLDKLVESLESGFIDNKGWDYFTDDGDAKLLPTAFAYAALASVGASEKVQKAEKILLNALKEKYDKKSAHAPARHDVMTDVVCMYVLCFSPRRDEFDDTLPVLKQSLQSIWKLLAPLLREDVEQTVEYLHRSDSFYVRIPWQLYLIALVAKLRPYILFHRPIVYDYLNRTLVSFEKGDFFYAHSSPHPSARTYAIAYECLSHVQQALQDMIFIPPLMLARRIRLVIGGFVTHWLARTVFGLTSAIFVVYCIVTAIQDDGFKFNELGLGFISSIVLMIYVFSTREQ